MKIVNIALLSIAILHQGSEIIAQNIEIMGRYDSLESTWDVFATENYVYVADYTLGLQIIDVSNPANPFLAGSYDGPTYANGVYVQSEYAYVAAGTSLQIINISDPAEPFFVGEYEMQDSWDLSVRGQYAYVISRGSHSLNVLNIGNPANPIFAGACSSLSLPWDIQVFGKYAYIADYAEDLKIVDISDPENPVMIGYCQAPGVAHGIYVSGIYAYIAAGNDGLQVINISQPANPILIGGYNDFPWGHATGAYASGTVAIIVRGILTAIDVTNPNDPVLIMDIESAGGYAVHGFENFVYSVGGGTLWIFGLGSVGINEIHYPNSPLSNFVLYPNPFNSQIHIKYQLADDNHVNLCIYDISGRQITKLLDQVVSAGPHLAIWNASGSQSGVYFVRLRVGDFTETSRITLIK